MSVCNAVHIVIADCCDVWCSVCSKCSFVLMSLAHNVNTVDVCQQSNLIYVYCIKIE